MTDLASLLEKVAVDELAQIIRRVNGNHSLGAGELAEAILAALSPPIKAGEAVPERVTEIIVEPFTDSSLVERLRGIVTCGCDDDVASQVGDEAADRISTLERELARMGEALKPFASEASRYGEYGDGSQRAWLNCTVADLRAARSALQSTPTSDRS